jgi:2-octaprenylphenol hydroxylase
MELKSDICVVGNGAVGKAAALGFAQAGLSVTWLTPPAGPTLPRTDSWDTRVYALNGLARDMLSGLRVWDALNQSRVAEVDSMVIRGDRAANPGRLRFDAYTARTDALAWIVEDSNLNQALDAALSFAPGLRKIEGRAIGMNLSADCAQVALENGDSLTASLLIGADGAQSWVRAQCDLGLDYRPYGQRAIVSNFSCDEPHHGAAFQWFSGAEGIIALLPLPDRRVSLVWSAPEALAEALLGGTLTQLADRLSALPDLPLGTLRPLQPESVQSLPLFYLRPHAMIAQRVALVGDAAHVVHPLAGHGMNLGFADVDVLLNTIADRELHRDPGDARLLGRYARRRKEDVLLMQGTIDSLERLFGSELEPVSVARNIGLNLADRLPWVKRGLISRAFGRTGRH